MTENDLKTVIRQVHIESPLSGGNVQRSVDWINYLVLEGDHNSPLRLKTCLKGNAMVAASLLRLDSGIRATTISGLLTQLQNFRDPTYRCQTTRNLFS